MQKVCCRNYFDDFFFRDLLSIGGDFVLDCLINLVVTHDSEINVKIILLFCFTCSQSYVLTC